MWQDVGLGAYHVEGVRDTRPNLPVLTPNQQNIDKETDEEYDAMVVRLVHSHHTLPTPPTHPTPHTTPSTNADSQRR